MEINAGIIVFVEKFQACDHFYRSRIGLPVLMEKPGIIRFALGSMYLQIEDVAKWGLKPTQNVIIRKNETSISRVQQELGVRGIELEVHDLDWGEIGFVFDPDGNKFEYFRQK